MILNLYWNVQIPDFGDVFKAEQNICWFYISMDDVILVQSRYTIDDISSNPPNFPFSEKLWAFSFVFDSMSKIAPGSQLHHCA